MRALSLSDCLASFDLGTSSTNNKFFSGRNQPWQTARNGKHTLLRGPDSSELEIDLVKIDEWLRKLDTDDALSTPELEFRRLYYTHLRDKIRFHLAHCLSRERGDSLPKNPAIRVRQWC